MFNLATIRNTSFLWGESKDANESGRGDKGGEAGTPRTDSVSALLSLALNKDRVYNVTFLNDKLYLEGGHTGCWLASVL